MDGCIRAIITDSSLSIDVEFTGLLFMSEYKIYYVIANDFPLKPITGKNAKIFE